MNHSRNPARRQTSVLTSRTSQCVTKTRSRICSPTFKGRVGIKPIRSSLRVIHIIYSMCYQVCVCVYQVDVRDMHAIRTLGP